MSKKELAEAEKTATCWIEGLDRIHKARTILTCFDFSATPYTPSGTKSKKSYEADLFSWIVSDFGLPDAIESGLTKTPRFVVRDDAGVKITKDKKYEAQLAHIYNHDDVKQDLNRKKAAPHESLPPLVQDAYIILGFDWLQTFNLWRESKIAIPPVMISAVNTTQTADRIKHMFDKALITVPELCSQEKTIAIHSNLNFETKKNGLSS